MNEKLRVVIADDHDATRAGVRAALEQGGLEVCGEASDARGAVRLALERSVDLCLLDVEMPGGGISAAAEITALRPDMTIVMLTDAPRDSELFVALKAGASGYLAKEMDPTRLPAALRDAHGGSAAIPRRLVSRVVEEFRALSNGGHPKVSGRPHVELSRREWEVLQLLHAGHGTGEIATRLSLSAVTIRRHISSCVRKLEVPDRAAAVRLLD